MTEQAKPTPGPWLVRDSDNGIYDTEDEIANVVARGPYGLITLAEEVDIADARLIAEAGTVYHETGLTPRQLAEQRAELLEMLEPFALIAEHDIGTDESDGDDYRPMQRHNVAPRVTVGHLRRALAVIAKAKGHAIGGMPIIADPSVPEGVVRIVGAKGGSDA